MNDNIFRYNTKVCQPNTQVNINSVTHKTQLEFLNKVKTAKRLAVIRKHTEGRK